MPTIRSAATTCSKLRFLRRIILWMMTRPELEKFYDMITVDAAAAINLPDFGLAPGSAANLVVLNQPDVTEALRFHERPAHVISGGRVLDPPRLERIACGASPSS
jgi:cytosine/creatinine deaminase